MSFPRETWALSTVACHSCRSSSLIGSAPKAGQGTAQPYQPETKTRLPPPIAVKNSPHKSPAGGVISLEADLHQHLRICARENALDGSCSGLDVGIQLAPQPLDIDHLAAAAGLIGTADIEQLELALEPEGLLLGGEGRLEHRGFRAQLPSQLEGDPVESRVGFGGAVDELPPFVLAHRPHHSS